MTSAPLPLHPRVPEDQACRDVHAPGLRMDPHPEGPVQRTHYTPAFTLAWNDLLLAHDEVGVPTWHYLDARSAEIDRLKCASPEVLEVVELK